MVLDDRRFSLIRSQDEGLKKLDGDTNLLREELKTKKKELDTSAKVIFGLNQ